MNSKQHIKISTIGGAAIAATINTIKQLKEQSENPEQKFNFQSLLKSIAIGAFGGFAASTLPDILEPATNPNHRKFFHSLTFASLILYGNHKLNKSQLPTELKQAVSALSVGYGLHLGADLTTPKSLPLI